MANVALLKPATTMKRIRTVWLLEDKREAGEPSASVMVRDAQNGLSMLDGKRRVIIAARRVDSRVKQTGLA